MSCVIAASLAPRTIDPVARQPDVPAASVRRAAVDPVVWKSDVPTATNCVANAARVDSWERQSAVPAAASRTTRHPGRVLPAELASSSVRQRSVRIQRCRSWSPSAVDVGRYWAVHAVAWKREPASTDASGSARRAIGSAVTHEPQCAAAYERSDDGAATRRSLAHTGHGLVHRRASAEDELPGHPRVHVGWSVWTAPRTSTAVSKPRRCRPTAERCRHG